MYQRVIQHKTGLRSDNQYLPLNFMLMNEILKMKLFSLLSGTSQVTNEQMQSAYDNFMKGVETVSQSEKDYSKIYRMLNTIRIELAFLKSLHRYEQGEKCPEICLSPKGFILCLFRIRAVKSQNSVSRTVLSRRPTNI